MTKLRKRFLINVVCCSLLVMSSQFLFTKAADAYLYTSGPTVQVFYTSATFSWSTDLPSDAVIDLGTSPGQENNASGFDPSTSTAHVVTVVALTAGTTYYYRVDSSGYRYPTNEVGTPDFTFQTLPLTVAGPPSFQVFLTSAVVTWDTIQPTDTWLYVTQNADILTGDSNLTTHHQVTVTNLRPSTQYDFECIARIPAPLQPTIDSGLLTTQAVDASLPFDFQLQFGGGYHVVHGHSSFGFLGVAITAGSYNNGLQYTMTTDPLPTGIQLKLTNGGLIWADGWFPTEIAVDASVPAGSYPLNFHFSNQGVTHNLTIPMVVDNPPAPLTRQAIASVPPIPSLAQWQSDMLTYGRTHCVVTEMGWYEPWVWYYDGTRVYSQIRDYTQDLSWDTCVQMNLHFYRDYIVSNGGIGLGWRNFPHGSYLDYVRTGDPLSKQAVFDLSDTSVYSNIMSSAGSTLLRETSYSLQAKVLAKKLGDPAANPDAYADALFGILDQWFVSQTDLFRKPFMLGLAMAALIEYYDYSKDVRAPAMVQTIADWLWAHAWVPEFQSFYYENANGYGPAPDLNLLIGPAYAWLWGMTGDPKYQQQADTIFQAGVKLAWLGGGKQFSQNCRWSFDFVRWRSDPNSVFNGPPPQLPPNPTTTLVPGALNPQVFPNPWRADKHTGGITFNQVVAGGMIKIFTVSGHQVREIPVTSTSASWDLANDKGDKVASGIYIYLATDGQGNKARGKMAVIK
jgi:hypothetical protein